MVKFTKTAVFFLLMLIIGISIIVYVFFPRQQVTEEEKFFYRVTFYDQISGKLNIPTTNITVKLVGENYNITLDKPNFGNETYIFRNLTKGTYNLLVYSKEFNLLLYNKTIEISRDVDEAITLPSQPLQIAVLINDKPSIYPYNVTIKNEKIEVSKIISPGQVLYISQFPLGNYTVYAKYKDIVVNSTNINVAGSISYFTLKTILANVTVSLFYEKPTYINETLQYTKLPLNNTSIYLIYQNKTIYTSSSSTNTFNITFIPLLNYTVMFNKGGLNLTLKESPYIDLSSFNGTVQHYNFTTIFGNLTVFVKYEDNNPARGILVKIGQYATYTGAEGNATFTELPANSKVKLIIERGNLKVLEKEVVIKENDLTISEVIIHKIDYKIYLIPKGNIPEDLFTTYIIIQDDFNKSQIYKYYDKRLEIQLYPGIYYIGGYLILPSNNTYTVYEKYIALNQTRIENITVPVGYELKIFTKNPTDKVSLYYLIDNGNYILLNEKIGSDITFPNLSIGKYKIIITNNGEYVFSTLFEINENSPNQISLSLDTHKPNVLENILLQTSLTLLVLLLVLSIIVFLNFRVFKLFKSLKKKSKE